MDVKTEYPLTWPLGYKRAKELKDGLFKQSWSSAKEELIRQLELLGAERVVISSNRPLSTWENARRIAEAERKAIRDPGVAVYFQRKSKDLVLACDSFDEIWKNVYAIALVIDGIRRSERYEIPGFLDNVFKGFQKLLPGSYKDPWALLGVKEYSTDAEIDAAYKNQARRFNEAGTEPNPEMMRDLNWARDEAKQLNKNR